MASESYIADYTIISLDFDGVLAHGIELKQKYAREWYHVYLTLADTKRDDFNSLVKKRGLKFVDYDKFMLAVNKVHMDEYKIQPHCLSSLKTLYHQGFRFVVITSRDDEIFPYAGQFLAKNFGGIIKYVHNTNNTPKDELALRLHVLAHMDDGLNKLVELKQTPLELLYYRQPENTHKNLPVGETRIKEIFNWQEFYNYLLYMRMLHEAICWRFGIQNNVYKLKDIFDIRQKLNSGQEKALIDAYNRNAVQKAA